MRRIPGVASLLALMTGPAVLGGCVGEWVSAGVLRSAAESAGDPAAKAGVEATLRSLEAACLAGDADAFLALIDRADEEFVHEQAYFARDLAKKKPEAITLVVGDLRVEGAEAVGPMTWTWTMPGGRERTVSFEARFVAREGTWLYAGETWERHEAPGVVVLHDPGLGELAARTVEAFVAVRGDVERIFGHDRGTLAGSELPGKTQKIKLYGSMRHLQQSICLSYVDGLAGWNEPHESVKLLASRRSGLNELKSLLAHEYGHVATFIMGPTSTHMPWWALEGVAEYASRVVMNSAGPNARVERWARRGELAPWDAIADFETYERRFGAHVYTQGHHMVQYITARAGDEARNRWLRAMSNGSTLDDATREALGMSFAELDAAWRATLPAVEKADEKVEEKAGGQPPPSAGS